MMTKINYIEPSSVPGNSAHSIQIKNNIINLSKNSKINLYSYGHQEIENINYNHVKFKKPFFLKKFLPFLTFDMFFKIDKNSFNKKNDYLYTRNPFLAFFLSKYFKKVILEVHSISTFKEEPLHYILFDLVLFIFPLNFLKYKKNVNYITVSKNLKLDLVKKYKISSNKIHWVPNGVDLEKFDINISKAKARKKLNLKKFDKIVLYVGSYQNWKGYDTLLRASNTFSQNIKLLMVGGNQKQIIKLKSEFPNVEFIGFVDQDLIPFYLKASDILVIPNSGKYKESVSYTSPLKLFEYMASKRPIIASRLDSILDILTKKDVVFFKPDSYKDLAKKVNKLILDEKLQKELARNSYSKVNNFSLFKRGLKIVKLFK